MSRCPLKRASKDLKERKCGHEERGACTPTKAFECSAYGRRKRYRMACARISEHCRSRPVRRQVQRSEVCQLTPPVLELGVTYLTLQPVTLPYGEVRILRG